ESYFVFFSSRRRHTRSYGDWSSDVCSSDLLRPHGVVVRRHERVERNVLTGVPVHRRSRVRRSHWAGHAGRYRGVLRKWSVGPGRSEERRVGKEGRARGGAVVGWGEQGSAGK